MNRHEEIWIRNREYDLVYILRSTYWEVILVDIESGKIVSNLGYEEI